jgi:hypothetical protein
VPPSPTPCPSETPPPLTTPPPDATALPPASEVQVLPPPAGDAGLLERVRSTGAHWAVISLAGMLTFVGMVSIGVAGVHDEPGKPDTPRTPRPKRRFRLRD